jgi:hypothetical protein
MLIKRERSSGGVLQSRSSCRTGGESVEYFFRKMNNDKVEVRSKVQKMVCLRKNT